MAAFMTMLTEEEQCRASTYLAAGHNFLDPGEAEEWLVKVVLGNRLSVDNSGPVPQPCLR